MKALVSLQPERLHEDVRALARAINHSPALLPFSALTADTTFPVAGVLAGGFFLDRAQLRQRLPDHRWVLQAYGFVNAGDANIATVELVYQKDDATTVALGSVTHTGATWAKKAIGPLDLFATGGVPKTETIVAVRLRAAKNAGANGTLAAGWTILLELRPPIVAS